MSGQWEDSRIDAALARLPQWQPTPEFAAKVAAQATGSRRAAAWTHLLPRGLSIAAGVSVGAWLSAEILMATLQWMQASGTESALSWLFAVAVLLSNWRLLQRRGPLRITS